MRLTVIGSGGGTGATAEISSGYLVTHGDAALLLDCGPGVATRLQRHVRPDALVGVVLSHMHFDHCADIPTLTTVRYIHSINLLTRDYSDVTRNRQMSPLPLHLPTEGIEPLRRILQAYAVAAPYVRLAERGMFDALLPLCPYAPGEAFAVGPFAVRAIGPVAHYPGPCFGVRIALGRTVLAYSGDSGPCDALAEVARDADLFLCDASSITSDVQTDGRHLSAEEAGRIATAAGAKQLVLTHLLNFSLAWTNSLIAVARRHYGGPIHVARPGLRLNVAA